MAVLSYEELNSPVSRKYALNYSSYGILNMPYNNNRDNNNDHDDNNNL